MKKIFVVILSAAFVLSIPLSAKSDQNKMDSLMKLTIAKPSAGKLALGKALTLDAKVPTVDCLIKSSDPELTAAAIEDAGGQTRAIAGKIMTATVPLKFVDELSNLDEVIFIEAAKPMTSKMNYARQYTYVEEVQEGTNLDKPYNGSNVLVGVVDNTLDWQNTDFNGSDNKTRVCYIHQRTSAGALVECTKTQIDEDDCSASQGGSGYHGTHVTGIAASANATYTGVAPQGYIAFAFNSPTDPDTSGTSSGSFSTTVLEGVTAIFTKADSLDLPAVVNLSLGTSLGAHDDTSLLEEGLNSLVSGEQGRIIVNAAGNENLNTNDPDYAVLGGIHASLNVGAAGDTGWGVAIRNSAIGSYTTSAMVTLWLDDTTACRNSTVEVKAYKRNVYTGYNTANANFSTTAKNFTADNTSAAQSTDGKVAVTVYTYNQNAQNSRPEALILINPTTSGSWSDITNNTTGYFFDVIFRVPSGSCLGEMWLYPDQTGLLDYLKLGGIAVGGVGAYTLADGDSNKTITIPGTASGVITVGSYMGRATWTDIDGVSHRQDVYDTSLGATGGTVDNISLFSSLGPTGEISASAQRVKPDVVAPGEPIISTLSRADTFADALLGDATHEKLEGTSMSSPHVAGIVALLLEKNNCLTTDNVRNALTSTAANVGTPIPNNTYGYGKVNAWSAIQSISANTSCYAGTSCGGSSNGGGGGCGGSVIVPTSNSVSIAAIIAIAMPLAAIIIRRKRR